MAPNLWFFWTRTFFLLSAACIGIAAVLVWANRLELVGQFAQAWQWQTVALVWLTLLSVTTCHEFAHGLTCKHHGGDVHEVGFLLLLLMPCFYCNVSDAWLFREKSKRLWVTFSLGFEIALVGTHPFHRSSSSVVFPDERYERILERLAWLTYQRVVFGLHIHVGVPDGELALGAINILVQYLPHLLALSANSPFWQGVDTGLASSRAALYRLLPHSGVPRYFGKWKEFRTYCHVMQDCKAMQSFKDIYWDIRPRPDFGTIEFRICDTPASLAVLFGRPPRPRSTPPWFSVSRKFALSHCPNRRMP